MRCRAILQPGGRPYHGGRVLKWRGGKANDKARGKGVQVGFRIFCQFAFQLQLYFDIKALEALVTPEMVGQAVNEVEEEAVAQEAVGLAKDLRE